MKHSMEIKVYYEDTDAGGVMYHASHIRFMERARTEFLSQFGTSVEALHNSGLYFVVTRVNIRYRQPARLGDILTVTAETEKVKKYSMTIKQSIEKGKTLIAEASITIALRDDNGLVLLPSQLLGRLLN